jgi:hypothetical protein
MKVKFQNKYTNIYIVAHRMLQRQMRSTKLSALFQVEVIRVVTLCSVAVGYQRFGGACYLYLHPENGGSKVTTGRHNPEDHYLNFTVVKTSNLVAALCYYQRFQRQKTQTTNMKTCTSQ